MKERNKSDENGNNDYQQLQHDKTKNRSKRRNSYTNIENIEDLVSDGLCVAENFDNDVNSCLNDSLDVVTRRDTRVTCTNRRGDVSKCLSWAGDMRTSDTDSQWGWQARKGGMI